MKTRRPCTSPGLRCIFVRAKSASPSRPRTEGGELPLSGAGKRDKQALKDLA